MTRASKSALAGGGRGTTRRNLEECVCEREVNELVDQVNHAKNSMSRRHGSAPYQHVFGCALRLPGSVQGHWELCMTVRLRVACLRL